MSDNDQWAFGAVRIDKGARRLTIGDKPAKIGARALDLLIVLAGKAGAIVPTRELLDAVWPNLAVEEGNLRVQVHALRELLGPQAIVNVPGRGYRIALGAGAEPPNPAPAQRDDARTLYGREREFEEIFGLARVHALITIVGPGGIGKTRLARALARAWSEPEQAIVIDLSAIAEASSVAPTAARALWIDSFAPDAGARALADRLSSRRLLVVLDNCERLIEGVAELAEALSAAAPHVKLVVTSQIPLKVRSERLYRTRPARRA